MSATDVSTLSLAITHRTKTIQTPIIRGKATPPECTTRKANRPALPPDLTTAEPASPQTTPCARGRGRSQSDTPSLLNFSVGPHRQTVHSSYMQGPHNALQDSSGCGSVYSPAISTKHRTTVEPAWRGP